MVEGYGILQPRIAPTMPAERDSSLFQRISSGPGGHRSLRLRGVRRVPGSLRRRLVHRQGHLRRGRLRDHAGRPRARGRAAEPRPLRGAVRAGRVWSPTSSCSRSSRRATRWRRPASIAGRAATGSSCPGCSAAPRADASGRTRIPRHRPLEDAGQPAPDALRARRLHDAARRVAPARRRARRCGPSSSSSRSCCPRWCPSPPTLLPKRPGISKRVYLRSLLGSLAMAGAHIALALILLAHQAWLMGDAMLRTLWRLVTRRRLLEWMSAAQVKARSSLDLTDVYARMWGAVALALVAAAAAALGSGHAWSIAFPFVALWLLSPGVARWLSLPPRAHPAEELPPRGARRAARGRAPQLALLRGLRRPRGSLAAAGQFPGGPAARGRAPDLADQCRPLPALGGRRARPRLDRHARSRRTGWTPHSPPSRSSSASAGISTTGTTRGACGLLEPRYVSTVDSGNFAGHLGVVAVAPARAGAPSPRRSPRGAGDRRRAHPARDALPRAADGAAELQTVPTAVAGLRAGLERRADHHAGLGGAPPRAGIRRLAARRAPGRRGERRGAPSQSRRCRRPSPAIGATWMRSPRGRRCSTRPSRRCRRTSSRGCPRWPACSDPRWR